MDGRGRRWVLGLMFSCFLSEGQSLALGIEVSIAAGVLVFSTTTVGGGSVECCVNTYVKETFGSASLRGDRGYIVVLVACCGVPSSHHH